jgi:uncharacterized protein
MTVDLPIIATCDGCSGCCRGRSIPPFDGPEDPEFLELRADLREPLRPLLLNARRDNADDAACPWLDLETQKCRHYDQRPQACRKFERGSFYCRLYRRKWDVPLIE